MKKTSRIARVFRSIFNIRAWADWDRIKDFALYFISSVKKMFVPQPKEANETFKAAQKRLKISNEDLLKEQKGLFRLSLIMLNFSVIIFCYAFYQVIYGSFLAFIVSLVVVAIGLTLAFRYHFWYYQIKNKKLGCSVHEWFKKGLMGEKE